MKSKKLLRLTIMDALDLVLMENGISYSSKKIRKTIVKASEKLSKTIQHELKKQQQASIAESHQDVDAIAVITTFEK